MVQNAFAVFAGEDFAIVSLGDVVQGAGDLQFRGVAAFTSTEFDAHGADAHGVIPSVVLPLESDAIVIPEVKCFADEVFKFGEDFGVVHRGWVSFGKRNRVFQITQGWCKEKLKR